MKFQLLPVSPRLMIKMTLFILASVFFSAQAIASKQYNLNHDTWILGPDGVYENRGREIIKEGEKMSFDLSPWKLDLIINDIGDGQYSLHQSLLYKNPASKSWQLIFYKEITTDNRAPINTIHRDENISFDSSIMFTEIKARINEK